MTGILFGWGLVVVILVGILVVVLFGSNIRRWMQTRKMERIVRREVPPPDRFEDQLRQYLERNRYGR